MEWLGTAAAVAGGLLLLWGALLLLVWRSRSLAPREALRLLPDLVRLVRRLAADRSLPRGIRIRLWLLLVYLVSPLDLVPDVIPLLGHADDVVLVAWTLRSVTRRAGAGALARHWPGEPAGLALVSRLAGLPPATPPPG
ncbi:YkvA family protein [Blastococcus sp. SYSU DS0617]